jgi:endonuclease/exonuclease/phosphatase family metal-dependent hydrolase
VSRTGRSAAALLAAVGCAVAATPSPARSTYTLMQMNLCLSGLAGCYARTAYPAVVGEAVMRIRRARPQAVTINEVCREDARWIARRTGYRVRFSRVSYLDRPLHCMQPAGRGLFGDAVLTKAAIVSTDRQEFVAHTGPERRRWLCVGTRVGVDVCTTHLNTRRLFEAPANDAQCAELAALLARRAARRTVVFGGDLNRRRPCAPAGMWARTDESAQQAPGFQHVYGSGALKRPEADVVPAAHTDHDVMLVRSSR